MPDLIFDTVNLVQWILRLGIKLLQAALTVCVFLSIAQIPETFVCRDQIFRAPRPVGFARPENVSLLSSKLPGPANFMITGTSVRPCVLHNTALRVMLKA